jgi:ABC-type transporter Mla subunit MlaD
MKIDRDPDESDDDELRRKRAQRLEDCLRDALDHADPLQAILRASSGDLAETAGQLKDAIDQAFQEEPDLRSAFAEIAPLLEMYLKY